jgi:hypothetical protein
MGGVEVRERGIGTEVGLNGCRSRCMGVAERLECDLIRYRRCRRL